MYIIYIYFYFLNCIVHYLYLPIICIHLQFYNSNYFKYSFHIRIMFLLYSALSSSLSAGNALLEIINYYYHYDHTWGISSNTGTATTRPRVIIVLNICGLRREMERVCIYNSNLLLFCSISTFGKYITRVMK